jgi:hypothetical protein
LQARRRAAQAEVTFYTSVVEYNKAIADLHFRKGTLLENNSVHLAEGAWTPEAYKDAVRRAWARSFAFDAPEQDPVYIEPGPMEREGDGESIEFISDPRSSNFPVDNPSPIPPEPMAAPRLPPAEASAELSESSELPYEVPAPAGDE